MKLYKPHIVYCTYEGKDVEFFCKGGGSRFYKSFESKRRAVQFAKVLCNIGYEDVCVSDKKTNKGFCFGEIISRRGR